MHQKELLVIYQFIKLAETFSDFKDEDVKLLATKMLLMSVSSGQKIASQDDHVHQVYVLKTGHVALKR